MRCLAALVVLFSATACATTDGVPLSASSKAGASTPSRPPPPGVRMPVGARAAGVPAGVAFARRDVPLAQVLDEARRTGRPALLLLRADWCGYCRMLEQQTLPDARVRAAAAAYTAVRYDTDAPLGRELARRYGVNGFPTVVRLDGAGNLVDRWGGFNEPQVYASILRDLGKGK